MSTIFFILVFLSCAAVVLSLVLGIGVMAKGGEASRKYSNALMQARIMLQGAAILFFILALVTAAR